MGCGIISSALEGILICLDPLVSVIEKRMSLTIKRFSKVINDFNFGRPSLETGSINLE